MPDNTWKPFEQLIPFHAVSIDRRETVPALDVRSRIRLKALTRGAPGKAVFCACLLAASIAVPPEAAAQNSPFERLIGRWVGEGRLGIRDNATEKVKCRVTYVHSAGDDQLRQSIRCASAGGNVEVQSMVTHRSGTLSGTWTELVRNLKGEISGTVTPRGFRVAVKGEALNANMDITLVGQKQVIEIQFIKSSLIGLTLILEKG
jgi:hypothetical protein